jgi:GAF domain/FHA domain
VPAPTLVIVAENRPPMRRPLSQTEVVMGRDPAADLTIDDGYLSRQHCAVSIKEGQVIVRDMGSYNGTYVNGQKIHEECFLLPGDVLKVGRTRVFVDWGDEQDDSLKIFAPQLEPRKGVQQVSREKAAALGEGYQGIADHLPPALTGSSSEAGPATRKQHRIRPDDKTPFPPPSIEDSAVARSSASRAGASRGRGSRDKGMQVIAQITRVLAKISDVHDLLDFTLSRILEVIPAERGIVMLLDPARRGLYAECVKSALAERDDQDARRQGISHTISRKVIRERVSILVDDAVLDQRFKTASSVQDLQIRSILCVPLWLGEQILGLIYLDHLLHAYAFTESDRELLVAAANLAALGLERLR